MLQAKQFGNKSKKGYWITLWLSNSGCVLFQKCLPFRSRENISFQCVYLLANTVKHVRAKHTGLITCITSKSRVHRVRLKSYYSPTCKVISQIKKKTEDVTEQGCRRTHACGVQFDQFIMRVPFAYDSSSGNTREVAGAIFIIRNLKIYTLERSRKSFGTIT